MYGRKCFQTIVTWIVGGIQWIDPFAFWVFCCKRNSCLCSGYPINSVSQHAVLLTAYHTQTHAHSSTPMHTHAHTDMPLARCWLFCCCEMKLTPKWWSSAIALKEFQNRKTSKSSARLWWSKGALFWSDNGCWHVSPLGLWTERAANYPSCNGPFWALHISFVCQLHQREEKKKWGFFLLLLLFYSFFA